jgi:hypothetical protein
MLGSGLVGSVRERSVIIVDSYNVTEYVILRAQVLANRSRVLLRKVKHVVNRD